MNIHTYSVHFIKKSGQWAQVGINKVYQKVLSGFMTQFWSQSVFKRLAELVLTPCMCNQETLLLTAKFLFSHTDYVL